MGSHTWVVAALNESPSKEQSPSPAATERATRRTPARPTAPCDLEQSQRSRVTQAYASCKEMKTEIVRVRVRMGKVLIDRDL